MNIQHYDSYLSGCKHRSRDVSTIAKVTILSEHANLKKYHVLHYNLRKCFWFISHLKMLINGSSLEKIKLTYQYFCLFFHCFERGNHLSQHQFQVLYYRTWISNIPAKYQQVPVLPLLSLLKVCHKIYHAGTYINW